MTFKLNKNCHSFIIKNNNSKNYLVSVTIGKTFYAEWKKYCLDSWKNYCKKNNLGILVINKQLIEKKKHILEKTNMAKIINIQVYCRK